MAERACPGGPAAARDELPDVPVRLEILLPVPQDLVQARFILPDGLFVIGRREMGVEQRPERAVSVATVLMANLVVDESSLALLFNEPRVLEQPKMSGDPRLGNSQNAR